MVGLLVGAVLGLLLSVLFEDGLKNALNGLSTKIRRARAHGTLPAAGAEFRLGPLKTTVVLIEGDGRQVIDEQAVRIVVDPGEVELPEEIEELRREVAERQAERGRDGTQAHWNGRTYAVAGFSVQRLGVDESPGVTLRLRGTDYFTFLATQQLDRVLPDGATLRRKYLDPYSPAEVPDFMRASFGVYVAVVTADEFTVFSKRSEVVGAFPGCWDTSVNEALSRSLDSQGRTPPRLYDVARRGLLEELGLEGSEYRLELLAFDVDMRTSQWGCVFVASLHTLTAAELAARMTRGIADQWEHEEIEFVRFTVPDVVGHLLRADRIDSWTPVAPAAFYLALVRRLGREQVERRLSRMFRKGVAPKKIVESAPRPTPPSTSGRNAVGSAE